jgi:hypothetical protein
VTPSSFNVRGSAAQVKYFAENNTVGLSLLGIAGPTLTSLYPTFYGMYSMSLWVNTKNGVNTAFYVSAAVDPAKHAYRQPSRHESHIQTARLLLCAWMHHRLVRVLPLPTAASSCCCCTSWTHFQNNKRISFPPAQLWHLLRSSSQLPRLA